MRSLIYALYFDGLTFGNPVAGTGGPPNNALKIPGGAYLMMADGSYFLIAGIAP